MAKKPKPEKKNTHKRKQESEERSSCLTSGGSASSCSSRSMKKQRVKEEICTVEEEMKPVSTVLALFDESWAIHYDDPWKIKKTLTMSDVSHMSRLLIPKPLIESYVLSSMREEMVEKIKKGGAKFDVRDLDTQTSYKLVLKLWPSTKGCVFINGWMSKFGNRRNLKMGDTIGLYWDVYNSRFNFSVLERKF